MIGRKKYSIFYNSKAMHSFSLEINIPDYFKIFYYAITPFLVLRILQNGDNLIENTKTGIFSRVYFSHF